MAKSNRKLIDLTGQVVGRWTVIKEGERVYPPNRPRGHRTWECVCECGNTARLVQRNLTARISRSCGCLNSDVTAQRNLTHGLSHVPEYGVWTGIFKRIDNPNSDGYENYGGRKIAICAEWRKSFAQFYADMEPRPTPKHEIERADNNGPYCASNCSWETKTVQAHNKRNNRWITYNGETLCWTDWGKWLGTSAGTIQGRVRMGWTIEQTVTTPVGVKRRS